MQANRSSSTAWFVAALRALESSAPEPLVSDPYALGFLPGPLAMALRLGLRSEATARGLRGLAELISRGRRQHIALRTAVIDRAVEREIAGGVRQLVLLGAGYDTRAERLAALACVRVIEVDHPATLARKRRLAAGRPIVARERTFVAIDFEHDVLADRLRDGGFDPELPALVLWEGVTMYLTLGAIRATLGALGACLREGSALLVTYRDPSGASGAASQSTAALAALAGERFRTALSPSEAAALLGEFGFRVESDTGRDDWARSAGQKPRGRVQERLLVARR